MTTDQTIDYGIQLSVAIRKKREELKMSQVELGRLSGVHPNTICGFENTPRKISLDSAARILRALQMEFLPV